MRVVITGAAGFLGRRLTQQLLQRGRLSTGAGEQAIERLVLLDVVPPPDPGDARVRCLMGDIADPAVLTDAIDPETDSIFHLAAVVSGMAEADFELGLRINLDATRVLLELCRAHARCPRVVFTSSVAVYGGDLPAVVKDATPVEPRTSYGMEKAVAELLISDYTRRRFIDGRVLRLPTISVRPGRPNAAASSFVSGIVREPIAGEPAVCPVAPETRIWIASPETAIAALIVGHELASDAIGPRRAINVPGLSVTARAIVDALARVAGPGVAARVSWTRDPRIEQIVGTWPGAWETTRARSLGFPGDESIDDIIHAYMASR